MRKVLILLLLMVIFSKSYAVCPDCWKLKAVNVEFVGGGYSNGYIVWNDEWKKQVDSADKKEFHEIVAAYYAKHAWPFLVYRNVLKYEKYFGDNILATSEIDTIKSVSQIQRMNKGKNAEFDGHPGKGRLQVIAPHFVDALQAGPFSSFKGYDEKTSTDVYILCFNPDLETSRLELIFKGADNITLDNLAASNYAIVLRYQREK